MHFKKYSPKLSAMRSVKPAKKPYWRGRIHQEAFFVSLGACCMLLAKTTDDISFYSVLVYSLGLLIMFGTSAIYHRPHWQPKPRRLLKKFDHAAIFVLIASTATPVFLLGISGDSGINFLKIMWSFAVFGIFQSIFWVRAPKWVTAILYVVMGWMSYPYLNDLSLGLGEDSFYLMLAGGVVYTLGAVAYAFKIPKLWPKYFGYHEVFHACTIVAASLHFMVVYRLLG